MSSKNLYLDIDGTLYYSNTWYDYIEFLGEKNKFIKLVYFLLNTKVFIFLNYFFENYLKISLSRMILATISKSHQYDDFSFFVGTLNKKKIESVFEYVNLIKGNYENIILVSGTFYKIAEEIAKEINADEVIATTLSKRKFKLFDSNIYKNKDDFLNITKDSLIITDNKSDLVFSKHGCKILAICHNDKDALFWEKIDIEVMLVNKVDV